MAQRITLYLKMLISIADTPGTINQISDRTGVYLHTARKIMRSLHAHDVVRVVDWVKPSLRGVMVPVYSFSEGEDVPRPPYKNGVMKVARRPRTNAELLSCRDFVFALRAPCSVQDMVQITGVHSNTARRHIRALRAAGLVYIAEWDRQCGVAPQPMYQFGKLPDKRRPSPKTKKDINRDYRTNRIAREQMLRVTHALVSA